MIEDARLIPTGTTLESDVCIVGAGAAGLMLAREFLGSRFSATVLEAGGLRPDRETQSLLAGEAPNYWPLEHIRLACLGGTTRVWAGWCRPLEPSVFSRRPWLESDGWPFSRSELDPFYERAHEVCQLGPYEYRVDAWTSPRAARLCLREDLIESALFHISPTHFGKVYRSELAGSRNVRVLLRAVAAELMSSESGSQVTHLLARTLSGTSFKIAARCYVLAAGGIENARVLLLSDRSRRCGLGNDNDLVGRNFTEHMYVTSGRLALGVERPRMDFYWRHQAVCGHETAALRGVFKLPTARVEAEQLLNSAILVLPPYESEWLLASRGARALELIGASVHRGWLPGDISREFWELARDPVGAIAKGFGRLFRRRGLPRAVLLRAYCEPAPNTANRVSLARSRDRLGRRRIRLVWRPAELEWKSIERTHELLNEAVRCAGLGRVERYSRDTGPAIEGGKHHMGTTRMHSDPQRGVVDADCRVHGVDNLFITGSSVFPTAGFANPTLTIVALALRLAEHLKADLATGSARGRHEGAPSEQ